MSGEAERLAEILTRPWTAAPAPHPRVTWLNAINSHGRVSRCYPDAEAAFDAAVTEQPFNNTRVQPGRCDGGDGCTLAPAEAAVRAQTEER